MRQLFSVALLASLVLTGCSSLARGGAAGAARSSADETEEEDDGFVGLTPSQAQPPGQTDVAWEDNGIPIRQLVGPGKPHEMKAGDASKIQKKPQKPAAAPAK